MTRRIEHLLALLVLSTATAFSWPSAVRADEPEKKAEAATAKKADDATDDAADDEKNDKKKEEKDRYFAVTGATVHSVTQGVHPGATILSKNGKIIEIGRSIEIPEGTEVLDATGFQLYPGLIAVASSGVVGKEPPDDTTDVYAIQMTIALAGGITTAASDNSVAKLTWGSTDDIIVKRDVFETLRYSTSDPDGRHKLREKFDRVLRYVRELEAYEEKKKLDLETAEPDKEWIKGEYEKVYRLIKREVVGVIDAHSAHDILEACELATRYGIRVVVRDAMEGWTVARQMARAGLSAIITMRPPIFAGQGDLPDERFNRPTGRSIENAAILHDHGVPIAIVPSIKSITLWGLAGRDLLNLNMEAAFAVRGGLPEDAAIRAITIDAARILGVDHRVGSIEVGKDADFVITDGELLYYMTQARWTVVNGRVVYDKAKESLLSHIRPGGDVDAPPPQDYWPRRLGEDQ